MKTLELIEKIKKENTITEKEVNLLKRRMNNGEKIDVSYIWDNPVELTPDQNKKGIEFLLKVTYSEIKLSADIW